MFILSAISNVATALSYEDSGIFFSIEKISAAISFVLAFFYFALLRKIITNQNKVKELKKKFEEEIEKIKKNSVNQRLIDNCFIKQRNEWVPVIEFLVINLEREEQEELRRYLYNYKKNMKKVEYDENDGSITNTDDVVNG